MSTMHLNLFPFERVPKGASIIIYGAGIIGEDYQQQINETLYCKTLFFIDNNTTTESCVYPLVQEQGVRTPDAIAGLEYDYIVVASSRYRNELYRDLLNRGVAEEKIVNAQHRIPIDTTACKKMTPDVLRTGIWEPYYEDVEKRCGKFF